MEVAGIPNNESERLRALREYSILDTLPEQDFEDITRIASEICQTPISLISLIDSDRQWFKSNRGLTVTETPRDFAFCAHAINAPNKILIVKDSRKDIRFADNPLVTGYPNVIFYAGVPLINPDGFSLGTICVIDNEPRELTENQLKSLDALSHLVVKLFEFRKTNIKLQESQQEIQTRNVELEQFASVVSHDIKSPLNNIISLSKILTNTLKGKVNQEADEIIKHINKSSLQLKSFIDGIISHYMGVNISVSNTKKIVLDKLIKEIVDLLDSNHEYQITSTSNVNSIKTNEVAIKQILTNIISNSIKYNDKAEIKIDINVKNTADAYQFTIKDNGRGIDKAKFSKIFETFATLETKDRFNNSGTGIGLATVKRLIEKLGGSITLDSVIDEGTTFTFSVKK